MITREMGALAFMKQEKVRWSVVEEVHNLQAM